VPPKGPRLIKSRLRRLPIPTTASFFALASRSRALFRCRRRSPLPPTAEPSSLLPAREI
jgi:hypothetical protein